MQRGIKTVKNLFKDIGISKSYVREAAFAIWVCMGTIFPVGIMFEHRAHLSQIWDSTPELLIAFCAAFVVETSILALLIKTSLQLEERKSQLKEHETELEQIIAERTKELSKTVSDLEIIASTDHLTKIANRRLLKETLHEEFTRAARTKREFAVIMFDIDHFKVINDTYGHQAGDKILVAFAKEVKKVVRDIDTFGRYGGEEFLVILPETNLQVASAVAERIRLAIAGIVVDNIKCTASIGVASNLKISSKTAMMEAVDDALYDAKDSGRNTTRIAKPIGFDKCELCPKVICVSKASQFMQTDCEYI